MIAIIDNCSSEGVIGQLTHCYFYIQVCFLNFSHRLCNTTNRHQEYLIARITSHGELVRWATARFTKNAESHSIRGPRSPELPEVPCPFYPLLDALNMSFGLNDLTEEEERTGHRRYRRGYRIPLCNILRPT